ncbi:MAG TPA: STAS domain-containing protein [Gammaproteobacteria bacterium]
MLRIEEKDQNCRAYIEGDMTIYTISELKDRLMPLIEAWKELDINLANVTEIDSAGVQLLMLAKKERAAQNLALTLSEHSNTVLDVFELMDLVAYFNDPVVLSGDKGEKNGS